MHSGSVCPQNCSPFSTFSPFSPKGGTHDTHPHIHCLAFAAFCGGQAADNPAQRSAPLRSYGEGRLCLPTLEQLQ